MEAAQNHFVPHLPGDGLYICANVEVLLVFFFSSSSSPPRPSPISYLSASLCVECRNLIASSGCSWACMIPNSNQKVAC